MKSLKAQNGMSLVEATIILLVLMLLTSVLAPSIYDFVVDARVVKVKEDCEAIGVSTMRLVRDVGPCLQVGAGDCKDANRAEVLYSRGTTGDASTLGWPATGVSMEEQFTTNQHGSTAIYPLPVWRGAYLPGPIGPDPWGTRYAVNVKFLGEKLLDDPTPRPQSEGDIDVFCISAGPNKKYETGFSGNGMGGTTKLGDDFIFVIAGSQYSRQF
jgi:type II secretory pathway pseudopilin PulG